ncbi:MAG: response regulator [Deltaproteobacteria bacterium]|nr:response regulator [Deltaproteobacteria bacterium]
MKRDVKLLVVDDSALFRRVVSNVISADPGLTVVGEAKNGLEGVKMTPVVNPDVVLLDINMPVMDGITALKHIMIRSPKPTVMFSTLTKAGAFVTFDALRCGAVDFIHKPSRQGALDMEEQSREILRKIRLAARVKVSSIRYLRQAHSRAEADETPDVSAGNVERVFVIGASEGGYGALLKILPALDRRLPATFLVVIHDDPEHVDSFIRYMDSLAPGLVQKARTGVLLSPGRAYVSSGMEYVTLLRSGADHSLHVSPSPFPGRRGAINMLMFSAAEAIEDRAAGMILSGSGNDGAEGLAEIARVGGVALVQEPSTAFCDEMPQSAWDMCPSASLVSDRDAAQRFMEICLADRPGSKRPPRQSSGLWGL